MFPFLRSLLDEEIDKSPWIAISFDESLNETNQACQMDIILRFWRVDTDTVSTRYYTSRFLGHATAVRLREEFSDAISKICAARVIQVSLDGPNVNLKFLREYQRVKSRGRYSKVLDIGSCHGAFQAGFKECK